MKSNLLINKGKWRSKHRGQAIAEYIILCGLIGIALISVIFLLKDSLIQKFKYIQSALTGDHIPVSSSSNTKSSFGNNPQIVSNDSSIQPSIQPSPETQETSAPDIQAKNIPLDENELPPIGETATASKLKAYVGNLYDTFPQFKELYEKKLGMTRTQVLSYMYGVMSRESARDGYWQENLITGGGFDDSGRASGPFQAAITNYSDSIYAKDPRNIEFMYNLGLPTPKLSQFGDLRVDMFTGMKRLAAGAVIGMNELGPGRPYKDYLIVAMSNHNTGWSYAAQSEGFVKYYGEECLRLAEGYVNFDHMDDDRVYWTNETLD